MRLSLGITREFSYRGAEPVVIGVYTASQQDVPCTTLDDTLRDFGPVKIDAEGAEQLILIGAKRIIENSPNLKMIVEFYPEKSLYDLVRDHGFKVAPILRDSPRRDMFFPELREVGICDALLTRRQTAA